MNNQYIVIVAGGSGTRMKSDLPKQFIEIAGKPILMHTIENFFTFDCDMEIVVVLPENQIEFWQELCAEHQFSIPHKIVKGGETRYHSVRNGLESIPDAGIVGIHDGVRPLVSHEVIERCFAHAREKGNAIPCIAVHESVREISENGNAISDRSKLRLIQTPQVFDVSLIKKAFETGFDPSFTDDASVLEKAGFKIELVEGNRENIKVTEPFDLMVAEAVMCRK
jgi:2-C-methyl-D-erythritol 4-phosphate cytidylyltransferase